jgi:hypothetical protein
MWWYAESMAYCKVCRIGALDQEGLCHLCGAKQQAPTRSQRAAETGGAVLSALLSPMSLALMVTASVLMVVAVLVQSGTQAPAMGPRLPWSSAESVLAMSRTDPGGALLQFLLPVIIQGLLFSVLLLLGMVIWRRLRGNNAHRPTP